LLLVLDANLFGYICIFEFVNAEKKGKAKSEKLRQALIKHLCKYASKQAQETTIQARDTNRGLVAGREEVYCMLKVCIKVE
jgi:hypothetical protein